MPRERNETRDLVLDLWAAGKTAGEIEKQLGMQSRSTVIGLIYRARQAGDARAQGRSATTKGKRFRAPNAFGGALNYAAKAAKKPAPAPQKTKITADPEMLKAIDQNDAVRPAGLISPRDRTERHCQSIYGHPSQDSDWWYCPNEKIKGQSWCACHLRLYLPVMAAKVLGPVDAVARVDEKEPA